MDLGVIIRGCLARKTNYQKILFEEFYDYAFMVAYRYLPEREEAALMVHNAFARFFLDIESIRPRAGGDVENNIKDCLLRIIVPAAIRKLSKKDFVQLNSESTELLHSFNYATDQDSTNPGGQLMSLLSCLPDRHRVLFNLHVIDRFSVQQMAGFLETSVSDCASGLSEAKRLVRELMGKRQIAAPNSRIDAATEREFT